MSILTDPKLFNYTIMSLYAANVMRWSFHGSFVDAAYWGGALWLTLVITFGYDR